MDFGVILRSLEHDKFIFYGIWKQLKKDIKESPARTTRASFPACGSSVITSSDLRELADRSLSGDAPSSMSEPFRKWLGMGAPLPARIQPGSIDHVPFPTVDHMTTTVGNNSVLKSFFEKQKLTGPNFIDWYCQLRKENYLEHPIPVATPGHPVPPEALAAHTAWVKGSKDIAAFMLITMDLEIQRNLTHLVAYDMLQELKSRRKSICKLICSKDEELH
ncbi:hypothetical protein CTI12_AA234130 [Artemisia annua]|uniref:Zinc finger, CCHC-type n=1 Tax=Artemisia annua TaxID=35608 RepID=A0A2U1NS61_ARTAN|nr:hypothetical protein CTI12_AA234130 [Artemisia annua]